MKQAAPLLTSIVTLTILLTVSAGCRLLPSLGDEDEVVTTGRRSWVTLDLTRLPPSTATPEGSALELSPLQQEAVQRRLEFLTDFVRDTNEWFMPFAATYLPSLSTIQDRRLIPVLSDGPLVHPLNQRDIEIRLSSKEWNNGTTPAMPVLRQELLRVAVNRILTAHPAAPIPDAPQHKNDMIRQLFAQGIPVYLSSFGMPADASPLAFALSGERDLVEEQFRVLREESPVTTKEERLSALTRAGIWICYKIETTAGTTALIKAVQDGPEGFYKQYLATGPGILLSLDPVPMEISPQMDELFLTH